MKLLGQFLCFASIVLMFPACKKSSTTAPHAAGALNVTNAVVGGAQIFLTTNYNVISTTTSAVPANGSAYFSLIAGQVRVNLGVLAQAAVGNMPVAPAIPYYSNTFAVGDNTNYSLFLTGTSPQAVDNVLISESYTPAYADSICGVRFINLSPGSNSVSVDIKGNANGSEVVGLGYKAY